MVDGKAMRSSARARSRLGFSLIEIMVVVAIIGVLSVVAIPMFRTYQLRSKTAEAKTNLGVMRVLEHSYFSEHNTFLAVAAEPPLIPGASPAVFDETAGFAPLGFRPEGRVYFSYGVAVSADQAGYTADAAADLDGDGFLQFWGFARPDGSGALVAGQVGCDATALTGDQVGPCGVHYGNSVF